MTVASAKRPAAVVSIRFSPLLIAFPLLLVAFALRLPAIVEPLGIDQGIFATVAWGMSQGLRLYADVWDQKPPGVHLLYRAAFAVLGPVPAAIFWLDFAAAAACCLLLYLWGRAASGSRLASAATCVFAIGSLPAFRFGYGGFLERAVPETFIATLVTAAAAAVTQAARTTPRRWVPVAGLAIGCAAVMKPTALIYAAAFAIWLTLVSGWRVWRPALLGALPALLAPIALTAVWLYSQGVARDAWIAIFEYNTGYVMGGTTPGRLMSELAHVTWRHVKTDPLWTLGFCSSVIAVASCVRARRVLPLPALCICWLGAAALAIAANGVRMFNSYFIPALPALAMITAWLLIDWSASGRKWMLAGTLAMTLLMAITRGGANRLMNSTVADWGQWRGTDGKRTEYLNRFGGYGNGRGYSALANDQLVRYVQAHTAPADRIYIFGMAPSVYFLSHRLPADRFVWVFPAVSDSVRGDRFTLDALARSLERNDPPLLILERNNRDSLRGWRVEDEFDRPLFRQFRDKYRLDAEIEDFLIFAR